MVDALLLIITIAFPLVMIGANVVLVAHYLHPDEKAESNLLKLAVVRVCARRAAMCRGAGFATRAQTLTRHLRARRCWASPLRSRPSYCYRWTWCVAGSVRRAACREEPLGRRTTPPRRVLGSPTQRARSAG